MATATEAKPAAASNGAAAETPAELPVETYKEAAPFLRRPFTAQAVKFKVQATWEGGALTVGYIDARLAIERLNLVIPDKWSDAYEATTGGLMWCHLTVDGITRRDVGEGIGKGLVSDSLKRAAVHFGVGVSLYAMPKLFLNVSDGHVKEKQVRGESKLVLTPDGETHCRDLYSAWLETMGKAAFGEPLDHGDADQAVGDLEAESQARRVQGTAEQPDTEPQVPQPRENTKPEDAEKALAELLEKKSTLKEKRGEANEGMVKLGAGPVQRLRELEAAGSARALDALIGRINTALDEGS